ncbi:MAG TPA: DUF4835 domain-containing protein [Flavobacterium sp.]|nr:DUF4835 domain-containing protein [Flavobacterium sp.]
MTRIIVFFLMLTFGMSHSQELNCTITLNTERLPNANQQVFKILQTSLIEFVNQTQWTDRLYKQNEKINCSMFINIASYDSDKYTASIQVQSSRLVYNSSYSSPVVNINDKDFSFNYTQNQQLVFNPAEFESNLISVISFYSYIILGMDADTFTPLGGNSFLETAQNIASVAQQSNYKGWNQSDGLNSRFFLVNDLLSPTYNEIRQTSLLYHTGLDIMAQDLKAAKEKIKLSLLNIRKLNSAKPNAYLTRVFFDAKSDEIVSIFSGGPSIPISDLVDSLNKTSPLNASKWGEIKY